MAPVTHTGRSDKDKPFATDLQAQLPTAVTSKTPGSILNNIENHLSSFPSKLGAAGVLKSGELDSQGTELWNLCTRLRRDFESHKTEDVPLILIMARVFAFLLLASAHEHGRSQRSNVVRLLKTGLKTTRTCLDTHQYDLALKALEKVASYLEILKKGEPGQSPPDGGSAESYSGLTAEYFILRTALASCPAGSNQIVANRRIQAWRHDDLKLAEYMYEKSTSMGQAIDPKSAENLADVLFEMGKDFFIKKEYLLATKWLERSYDVLSSQELDRMSMDASELRTSVISLWIKALLGLTDERSIEQANNLVGMLGDEQGDKLVVLLLRLEIISDTTNESFDIDSYYDILQRMMRTVFLSDSNLKLLMTHIRKLNDKSPTLACAAVDELFRLRMLKEGRPEWIEKLLVMRILMGTRQSEGSHTLASLEQILSDIGANLRQPISLAGVHAAHTLLWRRIESNFTLGQHELAERWCHLAMHQVFEKSGDINMTRISRKLLLCALARKDINNARELFGSMSDEAKNEPLTRFLMYKIAIRCGEIEFAAECLDLIGRTSGNDCTLIFACVLDAQQVENKQQALEALQILHEKYDYGAPPGVHFPSLLRTTIRLTDSLLRHTKDVGEHQHETAEKLCKLFEGATASIKQKHPHGQIGDALWNMLELEWFSKNSYNLAVENLNAWKPQHSVRILLCCITFIDAYPDDIGVQAADDLALKKMFCEFSVSIALTSLARGEDNIEKQLQAYTALRKHVESYDKELQKKLEKLEESPAEDLLQKLAILIAFDFEAACHLKAWDALGDILLKAEICKDMKVYELMADCVLSAQAPPQVLMNILRKIVNEAWALEQLDIFKLSKYMRCLFQISLSANMDIAEELLAQVQVHAEQAVESEQPYPHEELEWMATRAFNRAVDLYCGHEDEACRRWAQSAIGIAQCCADDGALEKLLQSKLVKLTWDNDA